jgi:hypothetical protein
MKKEKGTPRIWLKLPVAATPEVVEHAARMFKEAVCAATDDGTDDGVTMTVENRNAKVSLNTWNARSLRATSHIASVIKSPIKEINKYPASQKIAAALSEYGKPLRKLGGSLTVSGEEDDPILLDQTFVATLEGAAKREMAESDCLLGDSEVYSTVLRVGRMSESQPVKARITIEGAPHEVVVGDMADEQKKLLFDAVRTQAILRIRISSRWQRGDGGWKLDLDSMRIASVTLIEPVTGADFVRDLSEAIKPATEDEFAQILEDLSE